MEWLLAAAVILWLVGRSRAGATKPRERIRVVDRFSDVEEGELFRLRTDSMGTIRFQPPRPEGFTLYGKGIGSGEPVMGTSHRPEAVTGFVWGGNRRLEVEYAPSDEFPEAIAVFGLWDDARGSHREHIGYVEAATAKEIHRTYNNLPLATELRTVYLPVGGKQAGVRMWLLRAKNPTQYLKEPPKRARSKTAAGPVSPADELAKLTQLHAKGELTDSEFTAAKARLLEL